MYAIAQHIIVALAGGGGSSGGGSGVGGSGGSGDGGIAEIIIYPGILILLLIGLISKRRSKSKQIKKATQKAQEAETKDKDWDDRAIISRVEEVFYSYQADWSDFRVDAMKSYLTPTYLQHMGLVLDALKQLGRRNNVAEPKLLKAALFNVSDSKINIQDNFDIEIHGFAKDQIIDTATNKLLWEKAAKFNEFWHFERNGKQWELGNILQSEAGDLIESQGASLSNADPSVDNIPPEVVSFAKKNGFFVNADFGYLLMPNKGLLFSKASFGNSDINNHIIGTYKDVLVQFYEFDGYDGVHTIAQATLPKVYGDIVVRRRKKTGFNLAPTGMKKVTPEWSGFNQLYEIYALDSDQVSSLELINPSYMEKLSALHFEVNIEIVGSILYLFTSDSKANFNAMLEILKLAFEEMKM